MFNKQVAGLELLGRVNLFSGCSKAELRELAGITTELDVPAGRMLCKEGSAGHDFFVVVDGTATVTVDGEDVAVVEPGHGAALVNAAERPAQRSPGRQRGSASVIPSVARPAINRSPITPSSTRQRGV